MTGSFQNRNVLVTGAGQGIGFGLCQAFAEAGATVLLNEVQPHLANQAAATINDSVKRDAVVAMPFDVSNIEALDHALSIFQETHGALHIAIANAGITDYAGFLDTTPEQFDKVVAVNLRGSYFTAQAAAKQMINKQIAGRIVLMSSVVGLRVHLNLAAYGVTKAGIAHMAALLALELGGYGITVNAIAPGATLTERTQNDDPNYAQNWASVAPTGRVGMVEDIVQTALWVTSDGARHVTGQCIVVDGGWTTQSPLPSDHPELPTGQNNG